MSELTQVNISMEIEEAAMLDELAKKTSRDGRINRSATVRWLIRKEFYASGLSLPLSVQPAPEAKDA